MKHLIVIAFLFPAWTHLLAQHSEFQSLYMYDAVSVNPAYAGNKGALVLNANYRDQWGGIKGSPKTLSFTAHLLTKSKKAGLGFSVLNDKFGIQNNLKINAIYAYKIRLKNNELSFGLAGGIRDQSIDLNALNLNTPDDAAFMNQPRRSITPDFTFGAMYKTRRFLVGLSAPNLVNLKDPNAFRSVNGYLSAVFGLSNDIKLKPSALIKYVMHSPVAYEGNLTVYYRTMFSFGAGLRSDQTGNFHLRAQLNRQFGVAYLYERNFGSFSRFLQNTHEFMINYTFDYQTNVQSPRYL